MRVVLDSGGVSWLARRSPRTAARIAGMRAAGLWPAWVPAPVLVECLTGQAGRDAPANQLLKSCHVVTELPQALARRCARLRFEARRGSAVDAVVIGVAEPDGVVLTSDPHDLATLAEMATGVTIRAVCCQRQSGPLHETHRALNARRRQVTAKCFRCTY